MQVTDRSLGNIKKICAYNLPHASGIIGALNLDIFESHIMALQHGVFPYECFQYLVYNITLEVHSHKKIAGIIVL